MWQSRAVAYQQDLVLGPLLARRKQGAHLYQAASGPGSASSGTVRLRSSGGKMGSAVGVFSAVPPYIASLSSLFVPLSAPAEQSQGWPVLGHTCQPATVRRSANPRVSALHVNNSDLRNGADRSQCKLTSHLWVRASSSPLMAFMSGSASPASAAHMAAT